MALLRIRREQLSNKKDPLPFCSAGPVNDENLFKWQAIIIGPPNSAYENKIFNLSIDLSYNYPFDVPIVKFLTPILHPNVSSDGSICFITQENWYSSCDIAQLLLYICSSLYDLNQ
jgi:ubiquitin-conjugating enzyme E2 D/E